MIEIIEGNLGQSCKKNTVSPIFTIPTTIITRPKPKGEEPALILYAENNRTIFAHAFQKH